MALISAEGAVVRVVWVVANDDLEVLASRLALDARDPSLLPNQPSFRSYFDEHVEVERRGRRCPQSLESIGPITAGHAVTIGFDCDSAEGDTTISVTLLTDISIDYVTLAEARTPRGPERAVLRLTSPTMEVDFTTGAGESPERTDGEGRIERIVAALEGRSGATGLAVGAAVAFGLGAIHALTPGHGKTITAAYMLGQGGTPRQALALGGVVTATHALAVIALGALAIGLDEILLPGRWGPWIEIVAGLLILGMGALLLRPGATAGHRHGIEPHGRANAAMPLGRLAVIGLIGGLAPSPEAIGIILVAFSLERWAAGLLLVAAFSLGLAAVILLVALAAVKGGALVRKILGGRLARVGPRIAGAIFLVMGVVVLLRGASAL